MGVRVRKLARELSWSPGHVLGLLKALGYGRYRSAEDMVSDAIAVRVRKAARSGQRADPVEPVAPRAPRETPSMAPQSRGHDPMAQLVPGVRRQPMAEVEATPAPQAQPQRPPATEDRPTAPAPPAPPPPVAPGPDPEVARLEGEVRALQARVASLESDLASAREALDTGPGLLAVLEDRGLRGADEAERALAALAQGRHLARLLGTLLPTDPDRLRRLLDDQLVLVGGPVPEGLGVPAVTVSPERADVRGGDAMVQLASRLAEQLMLHGLRRVRAVGVSPRWHGVLRSGLDSRVEMMFSPGGRRDALRAAADVADVDLLLLWNVEEDEAASGVYAAARTRVLRFEGRDVGQFVEDAVAALQAE